MAAAMVAGPKDGSGAWSMWRREVGDQNLPVGLDFGRMGLGDVTPDRFVQGPTWLTDSLLMQLLFVAYGVITRRT